MSFARFIAVPCILLAFTMLCVSCSSSEEKEARRYRNQKGEYLYRKQDEVLYVPPAVPLQALMDYPWNKEQASHLPKITKEYFRCKGNSLNPARIVQKQDTTEKISDCGGARVHSLPLQNGKEFVYPILLELLNYIQLKTGKRVVITCGHRCPEHQRYADPAPENQLSKHLIGAEVSFYVQGMEHQPEKVVDCIQRFYRDTARYQAQNEYLQFKRYEKPDSHVAIQPWYNQEIFMKLYGKEEGRNFDNRHPYPYISVQVRYDREKAEKVTCSLKTAQAAFHRW